MTDRAVLIPTSEGAVGGIVSEPVDEPRGALVLLAGYGRPARSGVNSFWARLARRIADRGVVVLRVDYVREGETLPIGLDGPLVQNWKRELDLQLLSQVIPWFRQRTGEAPLLLAGHCSGARAGIELGGLKPDMFAGTFLIVPHLRVPFGSGEQPGRLAKLCGALPGLRALRREPRGEPGSPKIVDPLIVNRLQALLRHSRSWILAGEGDTKDNVPQLLRMLGPSADRVDTEIVPGMALHMADQPHIHREIETRFLAELDRRLAGHAQ